MQRNDTFRYHLKVGRKVVHRGITFDLERREVEHQQEFPGGLIVQVGRATTREAGLKWERKEARRPYKYPRGGAPRVPGGRWALWWLRSSALCVLVATVASINFGHYWLAALLGASLLLESLFLVTVKN